MVLVNFGHPDVDNREGRNHEYEPLIQADLSLAQESTDVVPDSHEGSSDFAKGLMLAILVVRSIYTCVQRWEIITL